MKKLFVLLFISSACWQVCAQQTVFVRVYGINGEKICKGHVFAVTDTSLQLIVKRVDTAHLSARNISIIRTKRSAGHNVLVGSLVGAGTLAILGAATGVSDPSGAIGSLDHTAGEGAVAGFLAGPFPGAVIGGITILFKKSKIFIVKGDTNGWKDFKTYISEAQ